MFVGDDLNCSFFFYKPMKLSNKMNIKHNSTIENRTEKTYSRLKFWRRASGFLSTGFLANGFLSTGFLALGFLTTGFFALNLQAQDAEDSHVKRVFLWELLPTQWGFKAGKARFHGWKSKGPKPKSQLTKNHENGNCQKTTGPPPKLKATICFLLSCFLSSLLCFIFILLDNFIGL